MSKKKYNVIEKPVPLTRIDRASKLWNQYGIGGQLFDVMRMYRDIAKEVGHVWKDDCYLPMELIATFIKEKTEEHLSAAEIFHLTAWRQYKQIYSIDSDFMEELVKSDIKTIPIDVFDYLPYDSFYVDCPVKDFKGFFVTRNRTCTTVEATDNDVISDSIHFLFVGEEDNLAGCPVSYGRGSTVYEAMTSDFQLLDSCDFYTEKQMKDIRDTITELMTVAVQLVTYICSVDSDVEENPTQKQIYRKSTPGGAGKDKLSSVRKWDVGYRIGRTLKSIKHSSSQPTVIERNPMGSSPKRPHIRRAHFHHFWTGKRGGNERKLIVKWVSPMAINIKSEELPATVINIK